MKNILIIFSLFISADLYAQDTLKVEDLVTKNKRELTDIYIQQVATLLQTLPGTALNESDIPTNKYLSKQFKSIERSCNNNIETVVSKYKSIIPYADKDHLIDAIMFLQEVKLQMHSMHSIN